MAPIFPNERCMNSPTSCEKTLPTNSPLECERVFPAVPCFSRPPEFFSRTTSTHCCRMRWYIPHDLTSKSTPLPSSLAVGPPILFGSTERRCLRGRFGIPKASGCGRDVRAAGDDRHRCQLLPRESIVCWKPDSAFLLCRVAASSWSGNAEVVLFSVALQHLVEDGIPKRHFLLRFRSVLGGNRKRLFCFVFVAWRTSR